jgi:hypothetical protein
MPLKKDLPSHLGIDGMVNADSLNIYEYSSLETSLQNIEDVFPKLQHHL